jgi:isopentenyl diphosphate isomerase/L-lactate dehydrogenase-like FMN-dependent dehydrogenase
MIALVQAVAKRAVIIIDGGFLRGADVAKGDLLLVWAVVALHRATLTALGDAGIAAGADIVAMGRLVAIALAAGGEEALVRAFDLLLEELHTTMGLMGVRDLRELAQPGNVSESVSVAGADWLRAAFPLLESWTGNF